MKRNVLNLFIGSITYVISYYLGGWDMALETLVFMVVLDYITGIINGIVNKELNSKTSIKGLVKKFCYFIAVALGVLLDRYMNSDIIRTMIIYFLVANDGISIVENLAKIGVPLPKQVITILEQMREKSDGYEEN